VENKYSTLLLFIILAKQARGETVDKILFSPDRIADTIDCIIDSNNNDNLFINKLDI
jgi:hypothetical protein